MSTTLPNQPTRIPIVDPRTGIVTREWARFFEGVFQRVGGARGLSTTDVDAGTFAAVQPNSIAPESHPDIAQYHATGAGDNLDISQAGMGCCELPDITQ